MFYKFQYQHVYKIMISTQYIEELDRFDVINSGLYHQSRFRRSAEPTF